MKLRQDAIKFLCIRNQKEWLCHVRYVYEIAVTLQKRYGGDIDVISLGAILHDIGRSRELDGEAHEVAGGRVIVQYLENISSLTQEQKILIRKCVVGHSSTSNAKSLEEKIITTADSASKLLYHTQFMLMCKKESYIDKAKRGLKYVEKGYKKIMFDDYKIELDGLYSSLKEGYRSILDAHI